MTPLTLQLPDETSLALRLRTPDDLGRSLLMAAAMKYYELGHLSAGAAARLAGVTKPYFLSRLQDYGIPALALTLEELGEETRIG